MRDVDDPFVERGIASGMSSGEGLIAEEMWVSTETIYQSPYVTSHGALRRELTACLRTGRKLRHPGRKPGVRKNPIPDMVNIAECPQEAGDRAVPGQWEGDVLIGKNNQTAIGTLVERATGYAMLMALPDGYKPEQVAPALATKIQTLPDTLPRSLAWDQGAGMRDWKTSQCRRRRRHLLL
jgi:transposase, IS30 family